MSASKVDMMEVAAEIDHPLLELRARYLKAQLSGDLTRALHLLLRDGVDKGFAVPLLQRFVLGEAQRELGQLWQNNQISVAQEHMATAISNTVRGYLYEAARRAPSNGKRVLLCCVEGELHDFPARLAADTLDLAGFEVRYLGADVPTQRILRRVQEERPDLVALSATMAFNLSNVHETVRQLRVRTGRALPIIVGGAACTSASALNADGAATQAEEIIALAQHLLGLP